LEYRYIIHNRCFSSCVKFFSFGYEKYFYGHLIKKRCVEVKWKMRLWMLSKDAASHTWRPQSSATLLPMASNLTDVLCFQMSKLIYSKLNWDSLLSFIHNFFWWSIYSSQGAQENLCHLHNQITPFKHSSFTKTHRILARKRQRNITLLHTFWKLEQTFHLDSGVITFNCS